MLKNIISSDGYTLGMGYRHGQCKEKITLDMKI